MSTDSAAAPPRTSWVFAIVAFFIGVVFGALGTIGHRHVLRIGEVTIPWGLVAALAGVTALLIGLRLLAGRLAAGAAALGVIGIVALLTLPGVGGSILVPGTLIGTIWAVGPAVISVFVVAWPSSSAFRRGGPTARAGVLASATTQSHAS
ncbi:hypothetical protein [Agromyces aerolatus]|uniref:hypothetical protein n=1 Tax=Agromyces sp. LY-1074 TaxID=3074080 RepID=UPI0028611F84|nr:MULTISPECIES: hypothetical protein [unclassified Agromyces]MDR5698907.1 hypothetical protein [Agromyces sp. LY-1074]MDR5705315.1 hypothetical protein [Agromyces sp. LY-1358]